LIGAFIWVRTDEEARALIAKYNAFLERAEAYQIEHCFSWKYLIDVSAK
jgi:tRNA nucleotidyltransferase (CCA-adding enzyme)